MKLFIVESPTKARTIKKYLGKGFVVKATMGHVKDLPEKELGVDPETLEAKYVYRKGKKKLVDELKRLAQRSEEVYLGTDPDREGEAIAYFLREELKRKNPKIKRATFREVTESAIKKSVRSAGELDMNLVKAQFARRILDRLIGYLLSPVLWDAFKNPKLSAGRVQSPALRLLVERERQIEGFKKRKYYLVKAVLRTPSGEKLEAYYDYRYENPSDAKVVAEKLKEAFFSVKSVKLKKEKVAPPKPFITSTLQAEADAKLGLPPEKTQKLAQFLYEQGFITYPRTDSYRINPEAAKAFTEFIKKTYGEEFVGRLRRFKARATAQEAHEAVRPTAAKPSVPVEGPASKLYGLIFNRTVASLMKEAEVERQEVKLEAVSPSLKRPLELLAKGARMLFPGWMLAYPYELKQKPLPELEEGTLLELEEVKIEEREVKPPERYTEGTLVKTLEKLGIGRPSTYAQIVKTLKERGYVEKKGKYLVPTELAKKVVDYLSEHYPLLVDYGFTAEVEKKLDEVEEGRRDWKEVVREFKRKVMGE
ncbi:MAG: type I DNA topoisomerase [Aquificae bacterium]|nr:type I DNA topoisomerase [Aquificota bacterium]